MPIEIPEGHVVEASSWRPAVNEPQNDPGVGLGEQLWSAANIDNIAVSVGQYVYDKINMQDDPTPDFNPYDHLTLEEKMNAAEYAHADSPEELAYVRKQIERENVHRRNVENGPVHPLIATGIAVATDPTTWLPIGGAVMKSGRLATKLAAGAAVGVAENAASEAILHGTQQTRTMEETAWAIGLGAPLGLIGAGGAAALSARGKKKLIDAINEQVVLGRSLEGDQFGSAGAKQVAAEAADTEVVYQKAFQWMGEKLSKVGLAAPALELGASRNPVVRDVVNKLADTGMVLKSHVRGFSPFGASVDTQIRALDRQMVGMDKSFKNSYNRAVQNGFKGNRADFHEQVARALRRGDTHSVKEIDDLAKAIRKEVLDPYWNELKKTKLFEDIEKEGLDGASYFMRVYNPNKIRSGVTNGKGQTFQNVIEEWCINTAAQAGEKLDPVDVEGIANEIMRKIAFGHQGRIPFLQVNRKGPLKGRVFNIPDALIEPWLENDAQVVMSRYIKSVGTDLAFWRNFGELTPDNEISKIMDQADIEIKALSDPGRKGGPLEGEALQKETKRIRDIHTRQADVTKVLWERIRGTDMGLTDPNYEGLKNAAQVMRTYSFMRSLGSVVAAQLPDAFKIVMNEGFSRTMGAAFTDLFTGFKGIRMGIKQAQLFSAALDLSMNQRNAAALSLGNEFTGGTKFNRTVAKAGNEFAFWTGMSHFNTVTKGMSSMASTTRLLEAAEAVAKSGGDLSVLSKSDLRRIATSRLNKEDLLAIAKEAEHWEHVGRNKFANVEAWKNQKVAKKVELAVLQDIDDAVITPGHVDAPLWTGTELGKTVFQFKRFMAAANQRVLLSGLQKRDQAVLTGVIGMIGMGALSLALRDLATEKGRERMEKRTLAEWIRDSIDRSGVLTYAMEMDQLGASIGFRPTDFLTGTEQGRFTSSGVTSRIAGPVAGLVDDMGRAISYSLKGDFTTSDLHRWRRLLPAQNHIALAWMFDALERGIADAAGLPERTRRK